MAIAKRFLTKHTSIALAVSATFTPITSVMAQSADIGIETIEVTATRRAGSLQEAPLNITALTSDTLAEQNIADLDDVARWVPGLTITDQGGRNDSPIIVRGLNTNSSGPSSDGGTVSTYVGEIPLFINMRLNDIDRVEVLIGPQGTLYGAGTLGGAIRYLPKKVELDVTSGEVYGDVSSMNESDSIGAEAGFVFNTPLIDDVLGVRMSLNKLHDPGFVDYNYLVREGGGSIADPDWQDASNVDSNLRSKKDANGEDTLSGKIALRWTPTEDIDATLTYFYQKQEVEGRSIVHYNALAESNGLSEVIGKYESAYRYVEPREKEDDLLSLELTVDLGFAELVSATGKSSFEALGQRDQTDLLIRLAYSYEEFPAFSSFTREIDNRDVFTQELRLVSKGDSALTWIVGGFYNKIESDGESREFTPKYDEFAVNVWETGGNLRPDSLEYISVDETTTTEKALYGEVSYAVTEQLDITLGARFYQYDLETASDVDFPLLYTSILTEDDGDFRQSNEIILDLLENSADDSGSLFKFNASYQFSRDVMGYVTVSEGFRIGGANGIGACDPDASEDVQQVCALPNERIYDADTTTNYELGFKSTWLKNKLHFNAALFNVDWDDAQVSGSTENGQQPILVNAGKANSKGAEVMARAIFSDELSAYATYAFTKAELTEDVTDLFEDSDAFDGDRLPGTPEHQFSLGLKYSTEVMGGKLLDVIYGITAQSDVYSTIGLHESGEALAGYALSNVSASLSDEDWSVTLYIDNLFDKYAYSSVRTDLGDIGQAVSPDINSNRVDIMRNYGHFLERPRTIGLKFNYQFGM